MAPRISAIVLHMQGRDAHLARALTALFGQRHPPDEVIVVSQAPRPLDMRVRWIVVEGANVAEARNVGVARSSGSLLAFCDDDATPEPGWIEALLPAFARDGVGAAGGPVRASDGIRIQWGETRFDPDGVDRPDGAHVKLHGTNMMIRAAALAEIGGFDPVFSYYLDETDMLLRMEAAGWQSVWVEAAEVHHASAPNAIRGTGITADGFRAMARSLAAFCDKHLVAGLHADAFAAFRRTQRERLLRRFQLGRLDPRVLDRLMAAVDEGLSEHDAHPAPLGVIKDVPAICTAAPPPAQRCQIVIASRLRTRREGRLTARALSQEGHEVTLIEWRWLRMRRTVRLGPDGVWRHRGGVYAPGGTDRLWSSALHRELERIRPQRAPCCVIRATASGEWHLSDSRGASIYCNAAQNGTLANYALSFMTR